MFIQGIGDEVISVLIALFITALVTIIWLSTHVQERPPVRTVVIQPAQGLPLASDIPLGDDELHDLTDNIDDIPNLAEVSPNVQEELENAVEATQESFEQVTHSSDTDQAESSQSNQTESSGESFATIKVRFINDTDLEIKERLSENLGRFIHKHLKRHLNLTSIDRVRIIYNGRVLNIKEQTLAQHGLTDNCVIHCIVRRADVDSNQQDANANSVRAEDAAIQDLDLSFFCFPLLGTLLIVLWWCHVVYARYFNLTTTLSLVSLTVLFLATLANSYLVGRLTN